MVENNLHPKIASTVEPQLSRPEFSGLFNYPDFCVWSQLFHECLCLNFLIQFWKKLKNTIINCG